MTSYADPVVAMMAYLRSIPGIEEQIEGRCSSKHHWGQPINPWPTGKPAILVRPSGGTPPTEAPVLNMIFDIRFYHQSQPEAMALWTLVLDHTLHHNQPVMTPLFGGNRAWVYSVLAIANPSLLFDDEVGMDYALGLFRAYINLYSL